MGIGDYFFPHRRRFFSRPSARTVRTVAGAGTVATAPFMTPERGTVARSRRPSGPSAGSGITPANAFPIAQQAVRDYQTGSSALRELASLANDIFPSSSISHMPENPGPDTLSSTNLFMPGRGTINKLANRASRTVRGKKVLRTVKGKRKLRVSKRLRKKIKQVVQADKLYGEYHTTRIGQIGVVRDKDSTQVQLGTTANAGGYGVTPMFTVIPSNTCYDWRVLWNGMCTSGIVVDQGDDFQFFTPLKILDAASVLWNEKGPNKDYGNVTGSFVTQVSLTTGAETTGGTAADPSAQLMQIHLINSFVEFEITNLSNRTVYMKMYFCVPSIRFPESLPLECFDQALRQETSGTHTAFFKHGSVFAGTQTQNDGILLNPSVGPARSPIFSSTFKYETVEYTIKPQETVLHSLQGPKNLTFDYNKFFNANQDQTGKMWKKSSVSLMVELVYDMQTLNTAQQAGRFMPNTTVLPDDIIAFPIAIEMRETFKLSMPENTGFIQRTVAAGTSMPLNMRKKILAYGNFTNQINFASAVPGDYGVRNEEDPLVGSAQSVFG